MKHLLSTRAVCYITNPGKGTVYCWFMFFEHNGELYYARFSTSAQNSQSIKQFLNATPESYFVLPLTNRSWLHLNKYYKVIDDLLVKYNL